MKALNDEMNRTVTKQEKKRGLEMDDEGNDDDDDDVVG